MMEASSMPRAVTNSLAVRLSAVILNWETHR